MDDLERGLSVLQDLQRAFDEESFKGAEVGNVLAKRRHISFHLAILAAKAARIEERADHGQELDATLGNEIIPDLVV